MSFTIAEIDESIRASSPVRPPVRTPVALAPRPVEIVPPRRLQIITAADFLAEPEPDHDDLVDGILPAQGACLLAGDPKSFKSLKALQLALSVAHGSVDGFLGRPLRHGPVLFVEEEGSRHKLRERMRSMLAGLQVDQPPDFHLALHQNVRLDEERSLREVKALAAELRPALIVLDPLVFLHSGDENKPSEMARVMRAVVELAAEHECCALVIHHLTKPTSNGPKVRRPAERLRGAGSFRGATDANLVMEREGDRTARLQGEYRDSEPLSLYLSLDPETLLLWPTEPPESARKVTRPELVAWVTESGQVGVTATAEKFRVTRNTARDALTGAVTAGVLDEAQDGRRTLYFLRNV